jgi:CheY-like chemotaxis protein
MVSIVAPAFRRRGGAPIVASAGEPPADVEERAHMMPAAGAARPAQTADKQEREARGAATGAVLVVDDDHDIRDLIRVVLEEEGYSVVTAENGEQALASIAGHRPDLILLDLTMPVLNGWQMRERLAESWPDIPIVFMTAGFRARAEAEAYRVAGYLAKPFDVDELLRVVSRFIAHG